MAPRFQTAQQVQRGKKVRPGGGGRQLEEVFPLAKVQIRGRGDHQQRRQVLQTGGQILGGHVPQLETAHHDASAQLPDGADGVSSAEKAADRRDAVGLQQPGDPALGLLVGKGNHDPIHRRSLLSFPVCSGWILSQ